MSAVKSLKKAVDGLTGLGRRWVSGGGGPSIYIYIYISVGPPSMGSLPMGAPVLVLRLRGFALAVAVVGVLFWGSPGLP